MKALSSHKKTKHYVISLTEVSGVVKLIEAESRMVIAGPGGGGQGKRGVVG